MRDESYPGEADEAAAAEAACTPPPDAQAMTREMVLKIADKVFQHYPFKHELNYWLAHDAGQRETIRRLTRDLDWQTKAHNACRDEIATLQARLTASEAKRKDDLRHYQASIVQLLRLVPPSPTESWQQSIIAKANHLLGIQGPLTPGEEYHE